MQTLNHNEIEKLFEEICNGDTLSGLTYAERIAQCQGRLSSEFHLQLKEFKVLFGETPEGNQFCLGDLLLFEHGLIVFVHSRTFHNFFSIALIQRPSGTLLETIRSQSVKVRFDNLIHNRGGRLIITFNLRVSRNTRELGPQYLQEFAGATIEVISRSGNCQNIYTIPEEHARMLDRWFETNM